MQHRGSLAIATVGLVAAGIVGGCGGGGGGQFARLSGLYKGVVEGSHTGTIKFYVSPEGHLTGVVHVTGCPQRIDIDGALTRSSASEGADVTWGGTGCDVSYAATGTIEPIASGSPELVGGGPYVATNPDGSTADGTWSVEFTGGTGTMGG